jgi:hypothetical protein
MPVGSPATLRKLEPALLHLQLGYGAVGEFALI